MIMITMMVLIRTQSFRRMMTSIQAITGAGATIMPRIFHVAFASIALNNATLTATYFDANEEISPWTKNNYSSKSLKVA